MALKPIKPSKQARNRRKQAFKKEVAEQARRVREFSQPNRLEDVVYNRQG